MKQELKTLDYKWLTEPTGDPFADAGGYALKEFMERYPDDDILELIKKATDIYVNRWSAGINAFFLNSKITQPAFKTKQKIDETEKYFREVVEDKCSVGEGYCRITGQKTNLFVARRDNSILSGSGEFINFHNNLERGLFVSKEMLIRFHFIPLACLLVQGRIALIHSNDNKLSEFFVRENCRENLRAIGMNSSEKMLRSVSKSPSTAIFRFIEKAWNECQIENSVTNYSLTLYHFWAGRPPEIKIYFVPAMLFAFYAFTQKGEVKDDWNHFVAHYYRSTEYKKAKYNEVTNTIDFEKKGEVGSVGKENFQNWINIIYEYLLNNKSILSYIRNWSETNRFSLEIVRIYLINIRNMKKETYQKIVELADFVVENMDGHKIGKYIQQIRNVKNFSDLSYFIVNKIIKQNYELNKPLLMTAEEYCEYLFPDDVYWSDVRNVLLIAIYQKLHEKNVRLEVEGDDDMENDDINQ